MDNHERRAHSVDNSDDVDKTSNIDVFTNTTDNEEKLEQETTYLTNMDKCFPKEVWETVMEKHCWNKAREDIRKAMENVPFYLTDSVVEKFESHEQVEKFLLQFDSSHCSNLEEKPKENPFPGHAVSITFSSAEQLNSPAYTELILKLLRNYGMYIWHISLSYSATVYSDDINKGEKRENVVMRNIVQFYTTFREMLLSIPNLKKVYLSYWDINRSFDEVSPQQLETLKLEISRNPLPQLCHLTVVTTSQNISSVFKEFLHQNRHIEHLNIHDIKSLFTPDSCGPVIESLTNLKLLSFTLNSLEDFEHFQNLPFVFQQTRFQFEYGPRAPLEWIPWSSVLKAVETKIKPNYCTELSLYLPEASSDENRELILRESLAIKLNISNLEDIQITGNAQFSLDFLLNLSGSLQHIRISKPKLYENEFDGLVDKQIVKFLGYEDQLQDSNIWKLFPKLKVLSVEHHDERLRYLLFGEKVYMFRE